MSALGYLPPPSPPLPLSPPPPPIHPPCQPATLADFKTPGADLAGVHYLRNVKVSARARACCVAQREGWVGRERGRCKLPLRFLAPSRPSPPPLPLPLPPWLTGCRLADRVHRCMQGGGRQGACSGPRGGVRWLGCSRSASVQPTPRLPLPPLQAICVGGGYIGMECAAALALNGLSVTMVFPESRCVGAVGV